MESKLVLEQQLGNFVHQKRYDKALPAALALNHSNKVMGILMCILEEEEEEGKERTPAEERLLPYLKEIPKEDLDKLLHYAKDWNTNSRYCFVSQAVLSAYFSLHSMAELLKSSVFQEALEGLKAYSERHFQRIDRLVQSSFVLEYMAGQMSLLPIEEEEEAKGREERGGMKKGKGRTVVEVLEEEEDKDMRDLIFGKRLNEKESKKTKLVR